VRQQIAAWKRDHEESALFSQQRGDELHVWDLRPIGGGHRGHRGHRVLRGLPAVLYARCDRAHGLRRLQEIAQEAAGRPVTPEEVAAELAPLIAAGLLLEEGNLYLSLAIPLGTWKPGPAVLGRFFELCVAPQLLAAEERTSPEEGSERCSTSEIRTPVESGRG
jgi:hypothetical protein